MTKTDTIFPIKKTNVEKGSNWRERLAPAMKIIREGAEILVVDPVENDNWDALLQTNPQTSFFHTSALAKLLQETYKYKPAYFTLIKDNKLAGLVAVAEVKSMLTGFRGVSLPFSDFCEVIADDD